MPTQLSLPRMLLSYAIPVSIFALTFFLLSGNYLSQHPQLTLFLALDLMLTAPVLYYLSIRKTNIPKFTVVSVFVIGTLIVSHALPHEAFPALNYVEMIFLPLLELGIVSFIGYFIYKKRKELLEDNSSTDYFYLINKSAEESLGKNRSATFLATEMAFVFYGIFHWKKHAPLENEFTYHKKSGVAEVLGTIGFVLLIEAFAMHLLIEGYSHVLAWVLTIGSVYAMLQIFAHIKACSRRPTVIGENQLKIRYGLFGDVGIDYTNIKEIETTRKIPKETEGVVKLCLVDMLETHNTILHLHEPVTSVGAYGLKKTGHTLLIHIDEKDLFRERIEEIIN